MMNHPIHILVLIITQAFAATPAKAQTDDGHFRIDLREKHIPLDEAIKK